METGPKSNIYRVNSHIRVIGPKMFDLTNVKALIERAKGLPTNHYADVDLYQHEQNTLVRDNWAAMGFGKDLPKQGCL